jgi:hypothetical protein
MFKELRKRIEARRESPNIFWRILIVMKDIVWYLTMTGLWLKHRILRLKYSPVFYQGKLPDFLVIGIQKGGTTSLWENLKHHPDIEITPNYYPEQNLKSYLQRFPNINMKEVDFFNSDKYQVKGLAWYKTLFNCSGKIQGDVNPNYTDQEETLRKISATAPNIKLIFIMREPIARAYSAWNHLKDLDQPWTKCFDPKLGFAKNIDQELECNLEHGALIYLGKYIEIIENLLKYFKREQILILINEQMAKEPQLVYDQIFDFLGIPKIKIKYIPNINKRSYTSPVDVTTKQKLNDFYKPYNERLFAFLGQEIKEWL